MKEAPRSVEAHALLAFADWKTGDTQNAVLEYQTAIRLDDRSVSAHYNLGMLYLQRGDGRAALTELQRASELGPDQPGLQYNLAVLLLDSGRPIQALSHLETAQRLEPGRSDTKFQLVRAFLALHQPEKAQQQAEDLKRTNPESAPVLARAFLDGGDPAEATAMLPDPSTGEDYAILAEAYYATKDVKQALRESREAVEREPANARFLLLRARLLQRADSPEAGPVLERAILVEPNWFELYYSRAVSYYIEQNYSGAAEALTHALTLNARCARCDFLLGVTRFNLALYADAETSLKRAVALDPQNTRYRTHLAAVYLRVGKPTLAVSELKQAIALAPSYAFPHFVLGKYLASVSQMRSAATELQLACRLDPQLTQAQYQLARVYKKLGLQSDAEKILTQFRDTKERQQEDISFRRDLESELAIQ